jgi:hypothetical protein
MLEVIDFGFSSGYVPLGAGAAPEFLYVQLDPDERGGAAASSSSSDDNNNNSSSLAAGSFPSVRHNDDPGDPVHPHWSYNWMHRTRSRRPTSIPPTRVYHGNDDEDDDAAAAALLAQHYRGAGDLINLFTLLLQTFVTDDQTLLALMLRRFVREDKRVAPGVYLRELVAAFPLPLEASVAPVVDVGDLTAQPRTRKRPVLDVEGDDDWNAVSDDDDERPNKRRRMDALQRAMRDYLYHD